MSTSTDKADATTGTLIERSIRTLLVTEYTHWHTIKGISRMEWALQKQSNLKQLQRLRG